MDKKFFLLSVACICSVGFLSAADFIWYNSSRPLTYTISENITPVVQTALDMWKGDLQQVTGVAPRFSDHERSATVRIIQFDQKRSAALQHLGVPVDKLAAKKEAFFIKIANNQLLVVGSDPRGTAYGILELSRLAGVSPWIWWGDVVPEKKTVLILPDDFQTFQNPSVEYRGIFLNDEDWTLQPWSWRHFDPQEKAGLISAKAYKEIFKLLLRLRANTIWPGMHGITTPFYFIPGAKEVADSCGIVVGTSHCEPLMCNANGEWDEKKSGRYNYITNKKTVISYWAARLKEVNRYDNIFTIGMRGKHDGSMEGVKTMREKTEALQKVIYDQRDLLQKYVNRDLTKIPQQFVPYKEVLDIYENGLDVPEDIMLTWCDDNYGYLTRLSNSEQQKRSGGAGVYYHLSYWGRPHDYMWLTTTQPGLIYYEMKNAYDHNARRLWIVNVHDLKPAAYDLELFLDMAWNINSINKAQTVGQHLENWLKREFGNEAGEKLFPAMREFYRLTAIRKPEFMGWNQIELDKDKYPRGMSPIQDAAFSFTEFGSEADRYLSDYENIKNAISEAEKFVPANRKDALFAAVKYPVFSAAAMAAKILEAQRARSIASGDYDANRWKRHKELMTACAKSMNAYYEIRKLTSFYNNELAGGKWKYSMCFNPRDLYVFNPPVLPIGLTDKEIREFAPVKGTENVADLQAVSDRSCIVRNACSFTGSSFTVKPIDLLGHSMNAVPLPKDMSLSYEFESEQGGAAVLRTAVIPTQPDDKGDIRFSVQIDSQDPQVISFKEDGRTEAWKLNVLRGQAIKTTNLTITPGKHTLKITAIDDHVVIDQWMLDFNRDREFYVFPVKPGY
ncbi:MAG: glycosyl hydrolase 115 family protein [Niabella sp.]